MIVIKIFRENNDCLWKYLLIFVYLQKYDFLEHNNFDKVYNKPNMKCDCQEK